MTSRVSEDLSHETQNFEGWATLTGKRRGLEDLLGLFVLETVVTRGPSLGAGDFRPGNVFESLEFPLAIVNLDRFKFCHIFLISHSRSSPSKIEMDLDLMSALVPLARGSSALEPAPPSSHHTWNYLLHPEVSTTVFPTYKRKVSNTAVFSTQENLTPVVLPSFNVSTGSSDNKPQCIYPGCIHLSLSRQLCHQHGGGSRCAAPDCTQHVVSHGKCLAHGGMRCKKPSCPQEPLLCAQSCTRVCIVEDCTRDIASNDLCRAHGGGPRCSHDKCGSAAQSRGLCYLHGGGGRCKVNGCNSSAKKGGFCISHGGGHRCTKPGCTSSAVSNGLCRAHGGGKRCKFPACTSSAKSGGLCIAHGGGKRCTHPGCTSSAQRNSRCKAHGGGRKCQVAGCTNSSVSRNLCIAHGGGRKCQVAQCSKSARVGGFCFAHGKEHLSLVLESPMIEEPAVVPRSHSIASIISPTNSTHPPTASGWSPPTAKTITTSAPGMKIIESSSTSPRQGYSWKELQRTVLLESKAQGMDIVLNPESSPAGVEEVDAESSPCTTPHSKCLQTEHIKERDQSKDSGNLDVLVSAVLGR